MITPNDIQTKRFERGMSGYRSEEVNNYLAEVAGQMSILIEENADLQNKLEILAERVEQYREDEDSLRAALIGAQKLGDSVVRDAKHKAEAIIAQAARKAEGMLADAQASIGREVDSFNRVQREVAKFKGQILQLYKQHIELIQSIPTDETPDGIQFTAVVSDAEEAVQAKKDGKTAKSAKPEDAEASKQVNESGTVPESGNESAMRPGESKSTAESGTDESQSVIGAENSDAFPKRGSSRYGPLRFGDAYGLTRKE